MDDRREQVREAVARAICDACGEQPEFPGDARGNAFRWQDYGQSAEVVMLGCGRPNPVSRDEAPCRIWPPSSRNPAPDGSDSAWQYERAAGDALRA
ncbi:hypothetical protein [Burkholderia stagnalis]|uniref:hypothetical protein n=1 Tax=Burkholderia stagnalis TaxID=1503054 RepID=UPI000A5D33AB|nr:hypothetical protein [Burkholderia stagnalis]MDY7806149.1 hypothetical protein [Burkholderia stagnalis]